MEAHAHRMLDRQFLIVPPKFRKIDSDRTNLVQEGLVKSMLITGATGVGKTVLMATIIKELIKQNKKVLWISYPELIMELRSIYMDNKAEFTVHDRIKTIAEFNGTLAIDDLGVEKPTDFAKETTYYIINHREQYELHSLITSNFSLDDIDATIDRRISSRLAGMCGKPKLLTGLDRRLK